MNRSGFQMMSRLVGLVKPLTGYMILAVTMGLIGHLCAALITVLGGYAILNVLKGQELTFLFASILDFALLRGFLRYAEQACNHFIAFKLLALIRDQVFGALRRLCPAKLEGKDKGDLIAVITSDIELLEVFYAHTISPIAIALFFSFAATVPVPLTGIHIHKMASAIFLLLCLVHTIVYRKKMGARRWLFLAAIVISFATGLFGMILDHVPVVLIFHRGISIVMVSFLAIHIYVFHKKLKSL